MLFCTPIYQPNINDLGFKDIKTKRFDWPIQKYQLFCGPNTPRPTLPLQRWHDLTIPIPSQFIKGPYIIIDLL
jgi:hypothetical protein